MNNIPFAEATDLSDQFGLNWPVFLAQLFPLIILVVALGLAISTTIVCLRRHRSDSRLPLWLLLTWLVPIAGPICTRVALRPGIPSAPRS